MFKVIIMIALLIGLHYLLINIFDTDTKLGKELMVKGITYQPIDHRSDIEKDWQGFNGTVEKTIIDNRVGRKTLVITGYEGDTIKTRWYKLIGNEWHSCILM